MPNTFKYGAEKFFSSSENYIGIVRVDYSNAAVGFGYSVFLKNTKDMEKTKLEEETWHKTLAKRCQLVVDEQGTMEQTTEQTTVWDAIKNDINYKSRWYGFALRDGDWRRNSCTFNAKRETPTSILARELMRPIGRWTGIYSEWIKKGDEQYLAREEALKTAGKPRADKSAQNYMFHEMPSHIWDPLFAELRARTLSRNKVISPESKLAEYYKLAMTKVDHFAETNWVMQLLANCSNMMSELIKIMSFVLVWIYCPTLVTGIVCIYIPMYMSMKAIVHQNDKAIMLCLNFWIIYRLFCIVPMWSVCKVLTSIWLYAPNYEGGRVIMQFLKPRFISIQQSHRILEYCTILSFLSQKPFLSFITSTFFKGIPVTLSMIYCWIPMGLSMKAITDRDDTATKYFLIYWVLYSLFCIMEYWVVYFVPISSVFMAFWMAVWLIWAFILSIIFWTLTENKLFFIVAWPVGYYLQYYIFFPIFKTVFRWSVWRCMILVWLYNPYYQGGVAIMRNLQHLFIKQQDRLDRIVRCVPGGFSTWINLINEGTNENTICKYDRSILPWISDTDFGLKFLFGPYTDKILEWMGLPIVKTMYLVKVFGVKEYLTTHDLLGALLRHLMLMLWTKDAAPGT